MTRFAIYWSILFALTSGSLASSSPSYRGKKLAFFSTDSKVDDNLALGLARHTKRYHRAHIFHDGVADSYGSMITTENTQRYMENKLKYPLRDDDTAMTRIHYEGESPFRQEDGYIKTQDHETSIFLGDQVDEEPDQVLSDDEIDSSGSEDLAFYLFQPQYLKENLEGPADESKRGDFFSHAPVPKMVLRHRLRKLAENGIQLDNFHHILGYNTRQDIRSSEKASDATQEYAMSLKNLVHQYHPNARVIITNSFHNLGGADGGLQPYSQLEKVLPSYSLRQIGSEETFYLRQMEKVYQYLLRKRRDPVPFQGLNGESMTQEEVWRARCNAPNDAQAAWLRQSILYAAHENLKKLKRGSHLWQRLSSVIKGLERECLGLACDFNHHAIVHEAIKAAANGITDAFVPIRIDANIKMRHAEPGEGDHGVTPHPSFNIDTAKAYLDDYVASFDR